MNLQYSQFITRTVFCGDHVRQMIHANLDQIEEGSDVDDKIVVSRFFALKGAKVTSWCGDREKFLGRYHGYGNPAGVAEEHCVTREMRTATAAEHSVRWCGLHRESTVSSHFWLE